MLSLLEGGPERERDAPDEADVRTADDDGSGGERLVCVACRNVVTSVRARVEVSGHHRHVCANPSGIPYDIGCFSMAPGCTSRGGFMSYWTWFPGFDWQIAVCASCGSHLGWAFRHSDGSSFHGLILARIVEAPSSDG